ncbi:hypothetical protein ABNR98_004411, partial [Salmonella enterica]
MLIRCQAHNDGAQEYLESGQKNGRDLHRDELDHRMILDGDLDLTRAIYQSIPDHGQDRYLSFTLSFKEDSLSEYTLKNISDDFKNYLMAAYEKDEFNIYSEAHLPKIKTMVDKNTGDLIDRKPHIHIIIPKVNLLSGRVSEPVGFPYTKNEKYWEAIQEQINRKYNLSSPRDNIRQDGISYADILSRYKGDEFKGKNKQLKKDIHSEILNRNIRTKDDFYKLIAEYGDVKIRNKGKDNEYASVKFSGDVKRTNLKGVLFSEEYIKNRTLEKPELSDKEISERINEWVSVRSKETKYVEKASPRFRKIYGAASPTEKISLIKDREQSFYSKYRTGENNEPTRSLRFTERASNNERSVIKARTENASRIADRLQSVPSSALDGHKKRAEVLLQNDVRLYVGNQQANRNSGLRRPLRAGRRSATGIDEFRARNPASGIDNYRPRPPSPSRRVSTARLTERPQPPQRGFRGQILSAADIDKRSERLNSQQLTRPTSTPVRKASTASAYLEREQSTSIEQRKQEPELGQLKRQLDPERLLNWLEQHKGLNPEQHRSFRARNGEIRITTDSRNLSVTDFLTKHMNMRWPEAKELLTRLYDEQRSGSPAPRLAHSKNDWKTFQNALVLWREQVQESRLNCRDRYVVAMREISASHRVRSSEIKADMRLTRNEKTQFLSVAAFERLKKISQVKELYQSERLQLRAESRTPYKDLYQRFINEKGNLSMSSAEIRGLVDQDEKKDKRRLLNLGGNQISAGDEKEVPIKERFSFTRLISNRAEERQRAAAVGELNKRLELQDFYTRSKGKGSVHYLDKASQKTHFVDRGNSIQLRRAAIKQESVGVALELAAAKFGSTLKVKGNAAFKDMIIAAAVEKKLDIRFTDDAMNRRMDQLKASIEAKAAEAAAATSSGDNAAEAAAATSSGDNAAEAAAATSSGDNAAEAAAATSSGDNAAEAAAATSSEDNAAEAAAATSSGDNAAEAAAATSSGDNAAEAAAATSSGDNAAEAAAATSSGDNAAEAAAATSSGD